jgi:hypothetical protein
VHGADGAERQGGGRVTDRSVNQSA